MSKPYEVVTEIITESSAGRPIKIASYTSTTPTHLHVMTIADVVDAVWIKFENTTATDVDIALVVNPATTGGADVTAAECVYRVPPLSSVWVMDGDRVRLALATYTVAAYCVLAADVDKVKATGHVNRMFYAEETL